MRENGTELGQCHLLQLLPVKGGWQGRASCSEVSCFKFVQNQVRGGDLGRSGQGPGTLRVGWAEVSELISGTGWGGGWGWGDLEKEGGRREGT